MNTCSRTCFVRESIDLKELFKDTAEEIVNDAAYENDEIIDYEDLPKWLIKRGVILPSSVQEWERANGVQEWERANEYFRDHLYHSNKVKDVKKEIYDMQNKTYEYFSETYGQVKDQEINEYKNWTKNQLKKHLKILKS